uniref:Uncharacterized protein n=1 Tax=Magallana gigas TaxID=29159 RepID=A0A8W8N719_MAGGI
MSKKLYSEYSFTQLRTQIEKQKRTDKLQNRKESKSNLLQIQHEGLHALFLGPDRVSMYDCHHHHHYHRSAVPKSLLHCQLFLYEHLLQHNFDHHQQHR